MDYKEAWDRQTEYQQALIQQKRDPASDGSVTHKLIICQHPAVYTLGKSGSEDNLIWNEEERNQKGVSYYKINRGGDITHHGPGQLVVYPIFDLDQFFTDVHLYVRLLEECVIMTLEDYGIVGGRLPDFTGVWLDGQPKRKICAIGVHLSRWVSLHGLAFNVNNDLSLFEGIIPCGIDAGDKTITSIEKELGRKVDMEEVAAKMIDNFAEIFEFEIIT